MPELGYTEYYLAKSQCQMGNDACIITSDHYFSFSNEKYIKRGMFYEEGIKVYRLPTVVELSDYAFPIIDNFKKCLTDFSPDIVHVHEIVAPMAFLSALCKHTFNYKLVADAVSGAIIARGLSLAAKTVLSKAYSATIWPYVAGRTDILFVCAEAAADWMKNNLPINSSKIHFVPLSTDCNLFIFNAEKRRAVRENLGIKDNDILVIYTGKLLPYKRIHILLCASSSLIKTQRNLHVLLVGKGPAEYIDHLRKIVEDLGIVQNVIFHNAVHRTELPSFYSAADFAVWPGHHSISIIEAMSTGLPVIVPDSKWLNHLVKCGNGFSYQEGNVTELRRYMKVLAENTKLRLEMGKKSRELVEKELDWNKIAEEYMGIYKSVLEDRLKL